jgi:hypothetical protein
MRKVKEGALYSKMHDEHGGVSEKIWRGRNIFGIATVLIDKVSWLNIVSSPEMRRALTRVVLLVNIYEMLIESVRRTKIRLLEVGKSLLEITKPDVGRRV